MVQVLDATCGRVAKQILGAVSMLVNGFSGGVARGSYKVTAMPPVARIPQRTVFGDDMA